MPMHESWRGPPGYPGSKELVIVQQAIAGAGTTNTPIYLGPYDEFCLVCTFTGVAVNGTLTLQFGVTTTDPAVLLSNYNEASFGQAPFTTIPYFPYAAPNAPVAIAAGVPASVAFKVFGEPANMLNVSFLDTSGATTLTMYLSRKLIGGHQ